MQRASLDLIRPDWPAPPNVVAIATTRAGGASVGEFASLNLGAHVGDEPASVSENRRCLLAGAKLPSEPKWLTQIHGTTVIDASGAIDAPQADAAWCRAPGIVCAVLTADCLPVLFSSADGTVVAAAHAGWRGLKAGVLENTVASMAARRGELLAWLGPGISQAHYEVGAEVREEFVAGDAAAAAAFEQNTAGRWQADLFALARLRLQKIGVERVFGADYCTATDSQRFFSYRRDGQCGRQAALIFRR